MDWKSLLSEIAEEINLDVEKESHDLISLAQYYFNKSGGRGKLNDTIREEFSPLTKPTLNHSILASLPIETYWTTNYDNLMEKALEEANKLPDIKITSNNLNTSPLYADAIVYKMHGDIQHVDNAVLTKHDYETYDKKYAFFREILESDLLSKTFLFLGLSFSDPNLNYVLAHLSSMLNSSNHRTHYCILKKKSLSEYNSGDKETDQKSFDYDTIKQDF